MVKRGQCLMIGAIVLGISANMTTIAVNYLLFSDPIPHKSSQLFYVQLDSRSPHQAARDPNEPSDQLIWQDATNLMRENRVFLQTAHASSGGVVQPEQQDLKPFNGEEE